MPVHEDCRLLAPTVERLHYQPHHEAYHHFSQDALLMSADRHTFSPTLKASEESEVDADAKR